MKYEVVITKHWSNKTYNVDLNSYDSNNWGISSGRVFDVSYEEAIKEANKQASIYNAPIIKKEGVK